MQRITIEPAQNGWIVKVGCSTFVSTDKEGMLHEIGRYIDDPDRVEKEYQERAVNKTNQPPPSAEVESPTEEEECRPQAPSGSGQLRPDSR